MQIHKKWNKGFTLMEAIVSIAIAGIVVVPLGLIFYNALTNINVSKDNLKMTQLAQNYVEYTKGVTIDGGNGFNMAPGYTDAQKNQSDFHYIKTILNEDSKYNTTIKVYPNQYLDAKNAINYTDAFNTIYGTADSQKLPNMKPLGDLSGNTRKVIVRYEEDLTDLNKVTVTYQVTGNQDPTLDYTTSKVFQRSELNGKFVIRYQTRNYQGSPKSDIISINNLSDIDLTVYVIKDMDLDKFPDVTIDNGAASVIKDSIYNVVNDRRLYKIVVTVSNTKTGKKFEMDALKNMQY